MLTIPQVMITVGVLYSGSCALNATSVDDDLPSDTHLIVKVLAKMILYMFHVVKATRLLLYLNLIIGASADVNR